MLGSGGAAAGCRPTRARSSAAARVARAQGAARARTRLLTLAGTGGAGKTRLALELAHEVEDRYVDGAALVELGRSPTPQLVAGAVAARARRRALPGRRCRRALPTSSRRARVLLVLDNCEHVLGASATLADALLRAAPRLTIARDQP